MDKNSSKQNLSRAQEKAKSFIEEYQVEKIISEMLNSLVHSRDQKPIIFMIKYLASLVTEQELDENGIVVTGPMPQRIPIITYPKFEPECDSLLKKHLTREIWANMKKKSTTKGGNIQQCVKSGVTKPLCEVGVMATDEEAYKVFGDLFKPIIKDIHPEFDFRFSYKFDELNTGIVEEQIKQMQLCVDKMLDYKLEAGRNFRGTPFTPLMTKESKLQVERKVVEVLGSLVGEYTQVHKLDDTQKEWLESVGIDPSNKSNPEFDAGGVNDDWPVGRGIFIEDHKKFVVLVNYEQHIKIISMKDNTNPNDDIFEGIKRLFNLLNTFEKLGFATDPYLGNLTVSPKDLGTGMKLSCSLILSPTEKLLDSEIAMQLKHNFKIDYQKKSKKEHTFCTLKSLAPAFNEMVQVVDFLKQIQKVCYNLDKSTIGT